MPPRASRPHSPAGCQVLPVLSGMPFRICAPLSVAGLYRPQGKGGPAYPSTREATAMSIDKRAGSPAEALAGVADGAVVLISGFGGAGFPNGLIRGLRERAPKNLTLVVNSATHRYSLTH